jgi:hypothetical protein
MSGSQGVRQTHTNCTSPTQALPGLNQNTFSARTRLISGPFQTQRFSTVTNMLSTGILTAFSMDGLLSLFVRCEPNSIFFSLERMLSRYARRCEGTLLVRGIRLCSGQYLGGGDFSVPCREANQQMRTVLGTRFSHPRRATQKRQAKVQAKLNGIVA